MPSRRVVLTAAALLGLAGLALAVPALRADTIDLQVYRAGGQAVLDGGSLYGGPVWGSMPFTYTPFAAVLFAPLAWLTPAGATPVIAVVNVLLLLGCAAVCWRAAGAGRRPALLLAGGTTGLLLATEAVHATVFLGQVNLLLMALVLWDLLGRPGRRTVGIGIGIAAGIKLTPLLFVAYLLVTRQLRAAAVAVGAFVATVAVGVLVLREQAVSYWLDGTFGDSGRVYADTTSTHNQSLHGLLLRSGLPEEVVQPLWLVAAAAVAGVTFRVAARAAARGERLLAVALVGMCGATISPWSWGHHWVWLTPLAVFLGSVALRPAHRRLVWLAPAALLPLSFPWVLALADPPDGAGAPPLLESGPLALLIGNLYVVVFAATLAAAVLSLRPALPERAVPERSEREGDVLRLQVLGQPLVPALAADAALLDPAEGRRRIADHAAVEPDHARLEGLGQPQPAGQVSGEDVGDQPELGAVGEREHLLVGAEPHDGRHRTEDLLIGCG
jgi:alpha-1,2-mannosyltransferase